MKNYSIKEIRKILKTTQVEFAALLGCDQSTISKWESNGQVPSATLIFKIIKLLKEKNIQIMFEQIRSS
jgi:DNA-binding transcriptional regulator YiaG